MERDLWVSMNEGDLRSKPLARSGDRREQIILSSFMVPYGQASHSPDHERWLTFRSQKTDDLIIIIVDQSQENRRPAVNFLARSGDRRERLKNSPLGTLRVGYALRDRRELRLWRPARTKELKATPAVTPAGRCPTCPRFYVPIARAQFACRGQRLCTCRKPSRQPHWLQSGLPSPHQFCT